MFLFKRLTLSNNSVTKKKIVVRTAYFYNSGKIFAAKKKCDRVCTQSKKLYEILASGKLWAGKWCITLGKDEKTRRNLYLLLLKTSL